MKLKVLVIVMVLFWTTLLGAETADIKVAAPIAQVPESGFTFATVVDGADVLHDFVIKNTGDAELKIEKVRTG